MPTVLRGTVHQGDFILSESGHRSRDNLTIASGRTIRTGEVCAIVTATGSVVALNPAASDGSQNAAVLPVYGYDASAAAVMGAFVTTDAEVKEDGLIWPAGITGPQKAAAIAALAARGIKIRPRSYVG